VTAISYHHFAERRHHFNWSNYLDH